VSNPSMNLPEPQEQDGRYAAAAGEGGSTALY